MSRVCNYGFCGRQSEIELVEQRKKQEKVRRHIVEELLSTERSYIDRLRFLKRVSPHLLNSLYWSTNLTLDLRSSNITTALGGQRSLCFSVGGELWYIVPPGTSTGDVLLHRLNPVLSRPTWLSFAAGWRPFELSADRVSESFSICDRPVAVLVQ